jgi:hypothetical protein
MSQHLSVTSLSRRRNTSQPRIELSYIFQAHWRHYHFISSSSHCINSSTLASSIEISRYRFVTCSTFVRDPAELIPNDRSSTASMRDLRGFIATELDRLENLVKQRPKSIRNTHYALAGVRWSRQRGWEYLQAFPPTLMSNSEYRTLTETGTTMVIIAYITRSGRRLQPHLMFMAEEEETTGVEVQKENKFCVVDKLDPRLSSELLSQPRPRCDRLLTYPDESFEWRKDVRVLYIDGRHHHQCLEDTCPVCQTD